MTAKTNAQRQADWRARRSTLTTSDIETLVRKAYLLGMLDHLHEERRDADRYATLQQDVSELAALEGIDNMNAAEDAFFEARYFKAADLAKDADELAQGWKRNY